MCSAANDVRRIIVEIPQTGSAPDRKAIDTMQKVADRNLLRACGVRSLPQNG